MENPYKSNFYFYEYLQNNIFDNNSSIDLMKYELDKRIYLYGNHFISNMELWNNNKIYLKLFAHYLYYLKNNLFPNRSNQMIVSSAHEMYNKEVEKFGYQTSSSVINSYNTFFGNFSIFRMNEKLWLDFQKANLFILLHTDYEKKIITFRNKIKNYLLDTKMKGLFLSNDMGFIDKILINVCKELRIPSFVFLHGYPSRFNDIDDNRADYLIVWGRKIKEAYINAGVEKSKIIISGHPRWSKNINLSKLKFEFDDILIITNSITQMPENSNALILQDRGALLTYLFSIQKVLQGLGIKSVRLRPHPSENKYWYKKNIDLEFYKLDSESLFDSLHKSSLVIGPISTVIFDAIFNKINYIVFEPTFNNLSIKNFVLVPPFDKSDPNYLVATNEEELSKILNEKKSMNPISIIDYIGEEFSILPIIKIIESKM